MEPTTAMEPRPTEEPGKEIEPIPAEEPREEVEPSPKKHDEMVELLFEVDCQIVAYFI